MMKKTGYGQVEPNHLSAQRTGQIYAQTPTAKSIKVLENGSFLKRNSADGTMGVDGNGEWMLVYNEVKLYDNAVQGYKDFAVKAMELVGGVITPRVFKTNPGDTFTTNLVDITAKTAGTILVIEVKEPTPENGEVGILTEAADAGTGIAFEVVKVYTLPDGQEAVKVTRVQ